MPNKALKRTALTRSSLSLIVMCLSKLIYIIRGKGMSYPYSKMNRLADVMALIQVLSLDKHAHRSEAGISDEMQGPPKSGDSWEVIAAEHPEFFRARDSGKHNISLVARHVQQRNYDDIREELSPDFVGKLLQAAIELHDREMERKYQWKVYIPIIVVITAGIFTLIGSSIKCT